MANYTTDVLTIMMSIIMLHACIVVRGASSGKPPLHANSVHVVEAQALIDFKKGIVSDPFGRLTSWIIHVSNESSSSSAAAARGYPCSAAWSGILCDAQKQHVTGLNLASSNLAGSISLSLALLPALSSLVLSNNFLHGTLPSSLFNLPHSALQHLDLSNNLLNGSLPDSFANLPALLTLDLSVNHFVGEIPPSLGRCKALQELFLRATGAIGTIPWQIWQLPALIGLEIFGGSDVPLKAALPEKFVSCPTIRSLELSSVIARGSAFPAFLSECKQLSVLVLNVIGLEGFIPSEFWQLPLLETLVLRDTELARPLKLHGSLPSSFRCCQTITQLIVFGVNLTGEIHPSLGQCTALVRLVLSHGSLEGEIPKSLGNLSNLQVLFLESNMLRGPIPKELGSLQKLQMLYLDQNQIHGTIPPSLGNCSALQDLFLSHNNLEGTIPASLGQLTALNQNLHLSNNNLSGEIPPTLGALAQLKVLDLSKNQLIGHLPLTSLENCTSLQYLRLFQNNLTGRIEPLDLFKMQQLTRFTVQENHFIGGLPSNFTRSKSLELFDVQRNYNLSGSLPSAHMDDMGLMNLRVLSMGFNQLSGEIPGWVWKLPMLQVLDLSNNRFRGRMPATVTHLNYFKQDNYTLNQSTLYEEVPQVIKGSFQVPSYILNTRIVFDISNNYIEGEITESFGELLGLLRLDLSHNAIEGRIPESLGNLVKLDELDLAHNKLTGNIPQELGRLGGLSMVDLSYNCLNGPIPTANNFNTRFNRNSFEGNSGLCGTPLPLQCSHGESPTKPATTAEHESRWAFLHWIGRFVSPWAVLISYPIGLLGGFYFLYRMGIIP